VGANVVMMALSTVPINEAPPGNLGDETALIGGHAIGHYFVGKFLHRLGRIAHGGTKSNAK
jgi:hypothetical protein